MNVTLNVTDEQLAALTHVVDQYNEFASGSFRGAEGVSYVEKSVEEYLGERCSDLLDKYVKSYMSYLESNPDNLKLYSDAVRYKNNPAVANVLRDLVIAVNAANEQ